MIPMVPNMTNLCVPWQVSEKPPDGLDVPGLEIPTAHECTLPGLRSTSCCVARTSGRSPAEAQTEVTDLN